MHAVERRFGHRGPHRCGIAACEAARGTEAPPPRRAPNAAFPGAERENISDCAHFSAQAAALRAVRPTSSNMARSAESSTASSARGHVSAAFAAGIADNAEYSHRISGHCRCWVSVRRSREHWIRDKSERAAEGPRGFHARSRVVTRNHQPAPLLWRVPARHGVDRKREVRARGDASTDRCHCKPGPLGLPRAACLLGNIKLRSTQCGKPSHSQFCTTSALAFASHGPRDSYGAAAAAVECVVGKHSRCTASSTLTGAVCAGLRRGGSGSRRGRILHQSAAPEGVTRGKGPRAAPTPSVPAADRLSVQRQVGESVDNHSRRLRHLYGGAQRRYTPCLVPSAAWEQH